jgi:hypothetical protein
MKRPDFHRLADQIDRRHPPSPTYTGVLLLNTDSFFQISTKNLQIDTIDPLQIVDQKIELKAESKIGSLANIKHKPGGGDKKVFNDVEYLRQVTISSIARGRCYDHNCLRFLPVFGGKHWRFSQKPML